MRRIVPLLAACLAFAACGGGSDAGGWTDSQRQAIVDESLADGYTTGQANCHADYLEDEFPEHADYEAAAFEELMGVGVSAVAECGGIPD